MPVARRRWIVAVAVLLAFALSADRAAARSKPAHSGEPSSPHLITIGIGDQKTAMFDDRRFKALDIRHVRYSVGWNVLSSHSQTADLRAWLAKAKRAGVDPLISFGHSHIEGQRRSLPTPERFLHEFRRFRAMFPWVKTFATWNEANHCGEPTCRRPELVAAFYNSIRRECPSCRILAAEVLDMPNMSSWIKAFRRKARVEPRYWGLHNYVDANRLRTDNTKRILRATSPRSTIWFTETGGIVARRNRSETAGFPESVKHAVAVTRWVFDRLVPLSRRITRVYIYQWNSSTPHDTWDSALIDWRGKARPSLAVVQRVVSVQNKLRRDAR